MGPAPNHPPASQHAGYAANPAQTRGRVFAEAESSFRSCWQRDRDRIIHSTAFRRLKHKTQVFVEHEGDHYRTRLTHSLEVAQVARTLAGVLGLNLDLTEAIALAHDLGHPPFGHTGEEALHTLMAGYGGFDHNAQAVRIVTHLERHYADFDGLNLTWETLEGIAKHNGPVPPPLPTSLAEYNATHDLEVHTHASLEAQVAALSDDIAYNHHDLLDGLQAGLFADADAADLPLLNKAYADVDARYPTLDATRRRHEALRRVFGYMVEDVIDTSRAALTHHRPQTARDVRMLGGPCIQFSKAMVENLSHIRRFLFENMYRAPDVQRQRTRAAQVVADLFPIYMNDPHLLPDPWQGGAMAAEADLARHVADYIAGMTDRFALQAHARLCGGGGSTSDIHIMTSEI